jgi:hypothetical protein
MQQELIVTTAMIVSQELPGLHPTDCSSSIAVQARCGDNIYLPAPLQQWGSRGSVQSPSGMGFAAATAAKAASRRSLKSMFGGVVDLTLEFRYAGFSRRRMN